MRPKDLGERIAGDASAQRLLNLFFNFNTSTQPLATDEIISDSDLGYGSGKRDSDMKKFRRDRDKLAEQGVYIIEATPRGAAESEESYWKLDRKRTFATTGIVSVDDAQTIAGAIDEYLSDMSTPLERPLRSIQEKALGLVRRTAGGETSERTDVSKQAQLDAIWSAFEQRKKLPFSYTDARGNSSKRTVSIYGIFSADGITYLTGLDEARDAIRTFRLDRIERIWKPREDYAIPPDFSVRDYLFMPFDFGEGQVVEAAFALPESLPKSEVETITRGRGTVADGVWRIDVRNLDAASSFALEHAREGIRPLSPPELVEAWRLRIFKAVNAHGA